MKKRMRNAAACAAVYILSFGLAAAVTDGGGTERKTVTAAAEIRAPESREESPEYIVKEHNGVVAVFVRGEDAPTEKTDIFVSGLRGRDRELVRRGIALESYSEVLYLLEDLNS